MSAIAEAAASAIAPQPGAPDPQPAPSPAPEPKPSPSPEPKPTPPTDAAKLASDKIAAILKKPESKPDTAEDDFEKEIKPNPKAWRVYEAKKKAWAESESKLQARIKELESKPAPTATDDAKLKTLEKQLEEVQAEARRHQQKLAEREFDETEEHKQINARWTRAYAKAYAFTKKLTVTDTTTGETRPAMEADFDAVMNAPIQNRVATARELFGDDIALEIVASVKELKNIADDHAEARANHSKNWEKIASDRKAASQREESEYSALQEQSRAALERDFPEYFSPAHFKDNAELRQSLEEGYKFVDESSRDASKMTPQDRAATLAVVRARAAAFVLLFNQNKEMKAKMDAMTAELEGLRGKDPGAIPAKGGDDPKPVTIGGIRDMAAKFTE